MRQSGVRGVAGMLRWGVHLSFDDGKFSGPYGITLEDAFIFRWLELEWGEADYSLLRGLPRQAGGDALVSTTRVACALAAVAGLDTGFPLFSRICEVCFAEG
jgi:hypothetical protein